MDNKHSSLNPFSLKTSKLAVNAWQRERWHAVGEDGSVAALEQHAQLSPQMPKLGEVGGGEEIRAVPERIFFYRSASLREGRVQKTSCTAVWAKLKSVVIKQLRRLHLNHSP